LPTRHSIVEVKKVADETPSTKTIFFIADIKTEPGQFIMVWVPKVDEIPMSLSYIGEEKGITVKDVGEATRALISLREGDKLGIRGPFGNSFVMKDGKTLAVGGGSGIATIAPAVELANNKGIHIDVCIGATTKEELLFRKRLERLAEVHVSTDDGSEGFKGFVTELAEDILKKKEYDQILTCGPEPMMKKIFLSAQTKKIKFQASLERFMKCGIGICDSCAFGPYLVCADGPVFTGDKLINVEDFGKFRRASSGKKVGI